MGRIQVVLFEPEIPQNAGNIMRTCVAFDCGLHLIGPLGFDIENPKFRRATTGHITWADYTYYASYNEFESACLDKGEFYFLTRYGKVPPSDIDFRVQDPGKDIYLIFGKESTGIPYDILASHLDRCFRIPMAASCRSLNLSNAAAIAIYECSKQLSFPGTSFKEVIKGEDFLDKYSYDGTLILKS